MPENHPLLLLQSNHLSPVIPSFGNFVKEEKMPQSLVATTRVFLYPLIPTFSGHNNNCCFIIYQKCLAMVGQRSFLSIC